MKEEPLKIAIFSDSALPVLNGVSISIDGLIHELRNQGHSVHFFTASYFGHKDADPNTHRFLASEMPWTKGYPLALPPFYLMLQQFRKVKFDVIHTHTPWTIGFVGLRWGQSHEIPVVSTYHTLYDKYIHYIPFLPKRYVRYKIAKHTNYYYNSVDQVITPSLAAQKWLRRHSVKKPISIIPTSACIYGKWERGEIRQKLGISPFHKILLYVGRIAKEKNIGFLFEAVAIAIEKDPEIRFWLVGDGPYREECLKLARNLGIGDKVRFAGFVPREQVDQYYSAADLFIFSSMTETQGLVVNEAMAHGLPALVVQGGGAGASIQDGVNGYLLTNDSRLFAKTILTVVDHDPLYLSLSNAAKKSSRHYSVKEMAERVLEIYKSSIEESHFNKEYLVKELA